MSKFTLLKEWKSDDVPSIECDWLRAILEMQREIFNLTLTENDHSLCGHILTRYGGSSGVFCCCHGIFHCPSVDHSSFTKLMQQSFLNSGSENQPLLSDDTVPMVIPNRTSEQAWTDPSHNNDEIPESIENSHSIDTYGPVDDFVNPSSNDADTGDHGYVSSSNHFSNPLESFPRVETDRRSDVDLHISGNPVQQNDSLLDDSMNDEIEAEITSHVDIYNFDPNADRDENTANISFEMDDMTDLDDPNLNRNQNVFKETPAKDNGTSIMNSSETDKKPDSSISDFLNNFQCSICLEKYPSTLPYVSKQFKHSICKKCTTQCLIRWYCRHEKNISCPICREQLDMDSELIKVLRPSLRSQKKE